MILAAAIDITINLLTVVHVLVSLLLILVVLMQRPKQEGLGAAFGGGMMDSFAGAGTTSFLQKGTVYLGGTFIALSLALAILIGNKNHQAGPQDLGAPAQPAATAPPIPEIDVPSIQSEAEKVLEGLGAGTPTTPATGETSGETTPAGGETPSGGAEIPAGGGDTPVEDTPVEPTTPDATPEDTSVEDETPPEPAPANGGQ